MTQNLFLRPTAAQKVAGMVSAALLTVLTAINLISTTNPFDTGVLSWAVAHRTPGMNALMLNITNAFTPTDIVIYTFILATGVALWKKSFKLWFAFFGAVGVSSVVGQVIKHIVGRSRPDLAFQIVHETDLSFPSGHATGIVSLVVALYLVLFFSTRNRAALAVLGAILTVLATLVCLSRVYVAAHWSTDVVAGAALGLCVSIAWFWVTEKVFTAFANRRAEAKESHELAA